MGNKYIPKVLKINLIKLCHGAGKFRFFFILKKASPLPVVLKSELTQLEKEGRANSWLVGQLGVFVCLIDLNLVTIDCQLTSFTSQ